MSDAIHLAAVCTTLMATLPAALAQTTYPNQPIRFIVTTAPGGGLDSFSRLLAKELTVRAGQQIIVDNRSGAGTTIGSAAVARAKPDGYTVLLNTSALAISPAIYQKLPYDTLRDFAPITLAASSPNLMVVHPSVPVKSIREMIALAKSRANQDDPILYASGGNGTNGHLATALFLSMAQIRMTHVPYKSGSLAVIDVIAGQVPVMMDTLSSVMPHVSSGKLRAIGLSSTRRAAAAPGIPTIAEAGVPGGESGSWIALLGPAGTPTAVIAKVAADVKEAVASADLREKLIAQGAVPRSSTPAELQALIDADAARYGKIIRDKGVKLE
jgi:tripartite-type tricarboxylate transporter receptor subunit TctC